MKELVVSEAFARPECDKTRWVYDNKKHGKGNTSRNKTRRNKTRHNKTQHVVKGYSQILRVDFTLVLSPVSQYNTVHLIFVVVVTFDWIRALIDVKNAFVNPP